MLTLGQLSVEKMLQQQRTTWNQLLTPNCSRRVPWPTNEQKALTLVMACSKVYSRNKPWLKTFFFLIFLTYKSCLFRLSPFFFFFFLPPKKPYWGNEADLKKKERKKETTTVAKAMSILKKESVAYSIDIADMRVRQQVGINAFQGS